MGRKGRKIRLGEKRERLRGREEAKEGRVG